MSKKLRLIKPKSRSVYQLNHRREAWNTVLEISLSEVPDDIPLTKRAINHADKKYYVDFKTLRRPDMMSILSAYKRREAMVLQARVGPGIAGYKIY